jgi:hypothetical protein
MHHLSSPNPQSCRRGSIGPAGVLARALTGIALIALEFAWRNPRWQDAAFGLVILPIP